MFTPSKMLLQYLNTQPRDMYDIIGALMGYINADPTFKTNDFDLAIKFVLDQGVSKDELFAEFDSDIEYEEDSSKWNEEYYSYARVYLKDNFCKKRINHVKAVAKKLYPNVIPSPVKTPAKTVSSSTIQPNRTDILPKKAQSQQHPVGKKSLPTVAKVAIAVGAIVLLALIIMWMI